MNPKVPSKNVKHHPLKYLPELVSKIKKDPDVVSLYLFGSQASGKTWGKSDIDLAVLLKEGFSSKKQYFTKPKGQKPGGWLSKPAHIIFISTFSL